MKDEAVHAQEQLTLRYMPDSPSRLAYALQVHNRVFQGLHSWSGNPLLVPAPLKCSSC
jgi:hypothetical protein